MCGRSTAATYWRPPHKAKSRNQSFSRLHAKTTSQLETQSFRLFKISASDLSQNCLYLLLSFWPPANYEQQKDLRTRPLVRVVSTKVIAWRLKLVQSPLAEVISAIKNNFTRITSSKVCEDISPARVFGRTSRSSVLADHVWAIRIF